MQAAVLRQSFNCGGCFSFGVTSRGQARAARHTIEEHGARAALAFATTVFSSGQLKLFTENGEQSGLGIGVNLMRGAVDEQVGNSCHKTSLRFSTEITPLLSARQIFSNRRLARPDACGKCFQRFESKFLIQ